MKLFSHSTWFYFRGAGHHEAVLQNRTRAKKPIEDKECLATLKHYRSLIPMGQEARKPIFSLTTADGAIGSHSLAVQEAHKDFEILAKELLKRMKKYSQ